MKLNIFIALCLSIFIFSCKKSNTVPKTVEQLLTEKTWKTDELRMQLSNNSTQYYKRGGSGNTTNYDSDSIKFNSNNTGVYYYNGIQNNTTWNFVGGDKTKITLVINLTPSPITVNLEYVIVTTTTFSYTQQFTGTLSYLASVKRIPN
ncbi:MAG: hypothetical protein ABL872_19030 [Lacibacter sp.]